MRSIASTLTSSYPQRHWYQGNYSELDPETGLQAFDLRMYSSRIGRWLSVDPYAQYWSPYLAMGNNPVSKVDPDGGADEPTGIVKVVQKIINYFVGVKNPLLVGKSQKPPKSGRAPKASSSASRAKASSGSSGLDAARMAKSGGVTVYVENDGIGHVYLEVNGTIFSYGRYDGSYSPSSGKFGPIGDGVLLKRNSNYALKRMSKSPTSVYRFENVNANAIFIYLNELYKSGTPAKNGGMVIDSYFLVGNNCTTITCLALQKGGVKIPIIQTPMGFELYMNPIDWKKYEEYGPKF